MTIEGIAGFRYRWYEHKCRLFHTGGHSKVRTSTYRVFVPTGQQVHYLPRPIVFISYPSVQRVSKLVSLDPELHSFQLHAQRLAKAYRNPHGAVLLFSHGLQIQ